MTLNGRGLDEVDYHLVTGTCELPNEPSGFIIVEDFLIRWGPVCLTRKTMFHIVIEVLIHPDEFILCVGLALHVFHHLQEVCCLVQFESESNHLSFWPFLLLSLSLSRYHYLSIYLCINHLSIYQLSIIYLCINHLSMYLPIYLCVCLSSIYLCINYLSMYLSMCLSFIWSIYLLSVALQPKWSLGHPTVDVSRPHTIRHTPDRNPLN